MQQERTLQSRHLSHRRRQEHRKGHRAHGPMWTQHSGEANSRRQQGGRAPQTNRWAEQLPHLEELCSRRGLHPRM